MATIIEEYYNNENFSDDLFRYIMDYAAREGEQLIDKR